MLLFTLWRTKQNHSCWIQGHRSILPYVENDVSSNLGKVYLSDDQTCDDTDKGEVQIKLNGFVWNLDDVRHIPNLRKNLIFTGQLVKNGYATTLIGDTWKISRRTMIVAHGKRMVPFT